MREFFKQELNSLKAKTGLNQYENFSAMKDAAGNSIAAEQIKLLIDSMVTVCSTFNYIPDEHKKAIIATGIVTDPDFTGLNARIVFKWLQAKNSLYFKQEAHQKETSVYDKIQLTEDQRLEVDKLLEDYKKEIVGGFNQVPKLTPQQIQEEGQERPVYKQYQGPSKEFLEMQARIRSIGGARYKDRINIERGLKLTVYYVDGYSVLCESQEVAQEIYIEAKYLTEKLKK